MNIHGNILIDLRVQHDYFRSGLCPGLRFVPWGPTARFMDAHDLRVRAREHGFQVIFLGPAPGSPPPVTLSRRDVMLFDVVATGKEFDLYTAPQAPRPMVDSRLFENRHSRLRIRKDIVPWTLSFYQHEIMSSGGAINIILRDIHKQELSRQSVSAATATIDLQDHSPGVYEIVEEVNGNILHQQKVIRRPNGPPRNLVGVLLLYMRYSTTFAYSATTNLELEFESRSRVWQYKIVLESDIDPVYYQIEDTDPAPPYPQIWFELIEDQDIPAKNERRLKFQSIGGGTAPSPLEIPDHEQPKRKLDLVRYIPKSGASPNSTNGFNTTDYDREVIYNDLPNPPLEGRPQIFLFQK